MNWRDRLRQAVKDDGRTQAAIAAKAGVPAETLSRVLNRQGNNPKLETIWAVAGALGVTVSSLLGEEGHFLRSERRQLRSVARLILSSINDPDEGVL